MPRLTSTYSFFFLFKFDHLAFLLLLFILAHHDSDKGTAGSESKKYSQSRLQELQEMFGERILMFTFIEDVSKMEIEGRRGDGRRCRRSRKRRRS